MSSSPLGIDAVDDKDDVEALAYAVRMLSLVHGTKRLDKRVTSDELAAALCVCPWVFTKAAEQAGHLATLADGRTHYYINLKALKGVVERDRREARAAQLTALQRALEVELARDGKTLKDLVKVPAVRSFHSARPSVRLSPDDVAGFYANLSMTGKLNTSAQVRACVDAYPHYLSLLQSYQATKTSIERLTQTVDCLPGMILSLAARGQRDG